MSAWSSSSLAASAAGYYPYDTSSLAAYGYGGAYGLAATRKNVTRESTATLKAWLNEHKKNPYPTKGEKIMLAIITKMTLTQVCSPSLHHHYDDPHTGMLAIITKMTLTQVCWSLGCSDF